MILLFPSVSLGYLLSPLSPASSLLQESPSPPRQLANTIRRRSRFWGTGQSSAGITPRPPPAQHPAATRATAPVTSPRRARTGEPRFPQPRRRLGSARGGHVRKERLQDESQIQQSTAPPSPTPSFQQVPTSAAVWQSTCVNPSGALTWGVGRHIHPLRPPHGSDPAWTWKPPANSSAPSDAAMLRKPPRFFGGPALRPTARTLGGCGSAPTPLGPAAG